MYTAIAVLFSYSIAILVVGDGALPMGFLLVLPLVMGSVDSWAIPLIMAPGWIGVVGLFSAAFLFRSNPLKRVTYQFLASILLYLSWLVPAVAFGNEQHSGSFWSSFVLSAPLHITFLIVAGRYIMFLLETDAGSNRAL